MKAVDMIHKKLDFNHIFLFFFTLIIFSLFFLWGFSLINKMLIKVVIMKRNYFMNMLLLFLFIYFLL